MCSPSSSSLYFWCQWRAKLARRHFVESDEHGGVNGAIYVEKGSGDVLHPRDAAFIKFRCGCGIGGVLHLGPIPRCESFVGKC